MKNIIVNRDEMGLTLPPPHVDLAAIPRKFHRRNATHGAKANRKGEAKVHDVSAKKAAAEGYGTR